LSIGFNDDEPLSLYCRPELIRFLPVSPLQAEQA